MGDCRIKKRCLQRSIQKESASKTWGVPFRRVLLHSKVKNTYWKYTWGPLSLDMPEEFR